MKLGCAGLAIFFQSDAIDVTALDSAGGLPPLTGLGFQAVTLDSLGGSATRYPLVGDPLPLAIADVTATRMLSLAAIART